MKRVALYVRVSHEEQVKHGISVDSQIDALEKFAKDHQYKIVDVYNDAGISARKTYKKRPDLMRMITDCRQGKIDLILITKLDRFFRSVPDYYAVMEQIGQVPWRAIWEDYETETANGIFKVNIMLSVSQSEADRTSERIKKVFEYKKAKGEVCSGGVATGFVIKDKKWYKDENTQEAVQSFFDSYFATFSLSKAMQTAREHGLVIQQAVAKKMLYHSDAYNGRALYVAEPYITEEQQAVIDAHKRQNVRHEKHDYIFSGLLKCGCCGLRVDAGRTIHVRKTDGVETHSVYYYCVNRYRDCPITSIGERALENYLLDSLDEELNKYRLLLKSQPAHDSTKKLEKLKARQKRLTELYEMGDISITEYREKRLLLLDEINSLEQIKTGEPVALQKNWKDIYNDLDVVHKHAFWESIIDYMEIPTRKAKSVRIKFK